MTHSELNYKKDVPNLVVTRFSRLETIMSSQWRILGYLSYPWGSYVVSAILVGSTTSSSATSASSTTKVTATKNNIEVMMS